MQPQGPAPDKCRCRVMRRVILLLTGDMRDQRLDAHQRQAPLRAQPLHLHPPRPGRLARHRHPVKAFRPRLPGRPVQRLAQPERLHPHRLARQHPPIMIDHRQRLLLLSQVDPGHPAIPRQQRPQPLPPRVPPPVPPRHPAAATLTHRTSSSLRLGHQARTTAPRGRSHLSHIPARQRPSLARCPITTAGRRAVIKGSFSWSLHSSPRLRPADRAVYSCIVRFWCKCPHLPHFARLSAGVVAAAGCGPRGLGYFGGKSAT
jgi:hypothetical protein